MRSVPGPTGAPVSIRWDRATAIVILKLVGQSCNIDCSYCYERRKPDAGGVITGAQVKTFLEQLGAQRVHCILHGGEPLLLGKSRMAEVLLALRDSPNVTSLSIQTNGSLLDKDWISLFADLSPELEWGISFDGDGELSRFRIDYRGANTAGRTRRGLELLASHGIRYGVISVITSKHVGRATQLFDSFRSLPGLASAKLVPCFDEGVTLRPKQSQSGRMMQIYAGVTEFQAGKPNWTIEPMDFADFVRQVQDEWIGQGAWRTFALEPTASIARNLMGGEGTYTDYASMKDAHVLTLYPGGRVAGHDRGHEFTLQESSVDGVAEFLDQQFNQNEIAWAKMLRPCSSCIAWRGCKGGELFMRESMQRAGMDGEFCDGRRELVRNVGSLLEGTPNDRDR